MRCVFTACAVLSKRASLRSFTSAKWVGVIGFRPLLHALPSRRRGHSLENLTAFAYSSRTASRLFIPSYQADIANDADFVYNTAMTNAAKDFFRKVRGVDCSAAAVSAYGYRNKACVALTRSENEAFLLSFHYQDLNPVGLRRFFVEKTMELLQARLLYLMPVPEKRERKSGRNG